MFGHVGGWRVGPGERNLALALVGTLAKDD